MVTVIRWTISCSNINIVPKHWLQMVILNNTFILQAFHYDIILPRGQISFQCLLKTDFIDIYSHSITVLKFVRSKHFQSSLIEMQAFPFPFDALNTFLSRTLGLTRDDIQMYFISRLSTLSCLTLRCHDFLCISVILRSTPHRPSCRTHISSTNSSY